MIVSTSVISVLSNCDLPSSWLWSVYVALWRRNNDCNIWIDIMFCNTWWECWHLLYPLWSVTLMRCRAKWLSGGRRWIKKWRWFGWTWASPTLMKYVVHIFLVYIEWHYAYRSDHYGHVWSKNTSTFVTCWCDDVIRFNNVQCQRWLIVLEFSDQRNQCPALLSVKYSCFVRNIHRNPCSQLDLCWVFTTLMSHEVLLTMV